MLIIKLSVKITAIFFLFTSRLYCRYYEQIDIRHFVILRYVTIWLFKNLLNSFVRETREVCSDFILREEAWCKNDRKIRGNTLTVEEDPRMSNIC